jgi:hypothetical protein
LRPAYLNRPRTNRETLAPTQPENKNRRNHTQIEGRVQHIRIDVIELRSRDKCNTLKINSPFRIIESGPFRFYETKCNHLISENTRTQNNKRNSKKNQQKLEQTTKLSTAAREEVVVTETKNSHTHRHGGG